MWLEYDGTCTLGYKQDQQDGTTGKALVPQAK